MKKSRYSAELSKQIYLALLLHNDRCQALSWHNSGLKLFRNWIFYVITRGCWHKYVDGRRLRSDYFYIEWIFGQIYLASISFINGYGRYCTHNLHLHVVTVDELYGRHQVVKDNRRLFAWIQRDWIQLSFNGGRRVDTLEQIYHVVHLRVVD